MTYSRWKILLLFLCQAIALMSAITMVTYSALVAKMLTGSTSLATIPAAATLIGAAFTAYPASLFMKKYGRRRGFQLGASFAILSGILAVYGIFNGSFLLFSFAVFLHGIFQSFAAFYRFAAMEVVPPNRHKQAISYVLGGGLVAALLAPTAAQTFEGIFYLPIQFAGIYVLVITLGLLSLITLSFLTFPDQKTSNYIQRSQEDGLPKPSIINILRRPAFLCASLNAAGAYLMMSYVMVASPIEIVEYRGFALSDAASVIQWHAAAMFLPAFFTGSLIARFGSVKMIIVGFCCFIVSASFAIAGLELINFYVALVLLGLGWNLLFTSGTALLERAYQPHEKAHVQGMNDVVVYGLTALSTLSSGYMLETVGWENMNRLAFGIVGLLCIVTLWYVLSERKTVGLTTS